MGDAWNLQSVAETLPADNSRQSQHAVAPDNAQTTPAGWSAPTSYDYSAMVTTQNTTNFDGNRRVYEFTDEEGDIGPAVAELEIDLFGDPASRGISTGNYYENIGSIDVVQEGVTRIERIDSFETAGLHPAMVQNVKLCGWVSPTPIQKYTIPSIIQGHDLIGIAQTGSGKTGAYLIPILSKLMGKARQLAAPRPNPATFRESDAGVTAEPLVTIMAPTRELAVQIFNEACKLCYRSMLRPSVVYGGMPIGQQKKHLSMGCDVLIGTPGRMADFLRRPEVLSFRRLRYMVIDEADTMLAEDEAHVRQILTGGEQDEGSIRYALFSATFPKAARAIAEDFLSVEHVHFHVGRAGSTTENIQQRVYEVDRAGKKDLLIAELAGLPGRRTIIFVNSRAEADNLDDFLFNLGLPVVSIHSQRTQLERELSMRQFRAGKCPILVATGVTARGIDVKNVEHIINYDLPSMDHGGIEEYTHRIGRTGRIGHRGIATSFFTDRDEPIASVLTKTLCETKQEIPDFLKQYVPDMSKGISFDDDEEAGFGQDGQAGVEAGGWDGNQGGEAAGGWGGNQGGEAAGGWGGNQGGEAASGWSGNQGGEAASGWDGDQGGQLASANTDASANSRNHWGHASGASEPQGW